MKVMDLKKMSKKKLAELQDAVSAEMRDRNAKGDFGMTGALVDNSVGGDPKDVYRNLNPVDPLFKMKQRVNEENRARLQTAADEQTKDPEAFAAKMKMFVDGIMPVPGSVDVKAAAGNVKEFARSDFPETALLAHAMARAGLFPSVGQARKAGWDRPIETGEWTVGKNRIKVVIK